MKITCIIPSSCTKKTLPSIKRCIGSLRNAQTLNLSLYIVVVSDGPVARTKLLNEKINNFFLVSPAAGFSDRNNIAIEETINLIPSDYYLLINDDAWVEKDFFIQFITRISKSKADLVNPIVYKGTSTIIDSCGVEYFKSGYAKNATDTTIVTALVTAACLLIKTVLLKQMYTRYGYVFNPLYHYYLEDVDFSLRARGVGAVINKNANLVIHHDISQTSLNESRFVKYHSCRNMLWVIVMTWPLTDIIKHIHQIVLVFLWVIISGFSFNTPLVLFQILRDTVITLPSLFYYRKINISSYNQRFLFSSVFSPFTFRARKRGFAF
jgi:GT2 family glycosyltransferase